MEWFRNDLLKGGQEPELILASASPRRQQLLADMGFTFGVMSLDVDESLDAGIDPEEAAIMLSRRKAMALADDFCSDDKVIITADTIVAWQGQVLGKPADAAEAYAMLTKLSGGDHYVYTGVTLRRGAELRSFAASSRVWFARLAPEEIEYYVEHFKPYDKAGAYGIQEWIGYIGIERIEGSFYNVMGLPTHMLYEELRKMMAG